MENECVKVLLIEDDPDYPQLIQVVLAQGKDTIFDLEFADTLQAGLERLAAGGINAILLDLSLPDSRGLDTFVKVYAQAPEVPIIVLSCLDDEKLAIEAVSEGAQDYLVKDRVDSDQLVRSVRYAIGRHRMLGELKQKTWELQVSEAENQAMLDAIPDLILQISKDGILLDYRGAKDDDVAMPSDEFLGKKAYEALPSETAHNIMYGVESALETGEAQLLEYQALHKGDSRYYEARTIPLPGENKALVIVRDINARKELDRMKSEFFWRLKGTKLR